MRTRPSPEFSECMAIFIFHPSKMKSNSRGMDWIWVKAVARSSLIQSQPFSSPPLCRMPMPIWHGNKIFHSLSSSILKSSSFSWNLAKNRNFAVSSLGGCVVRVRVRIMLCSRASFPTSIRNLHLWASVPAHFPHLRPRPRPRTKAKTCEYNITDALTNWHSYHIRISCYMHNAYSYYCYFYMDGYFYFYFYNSYNIQSPDLFYFHLPFYIYPNINLKQTHRHSVVCTPKSTLHRWAHTSIPTSPHRSTDDRWSNGKKILIFSTFTRSLEIAACLAPGPLSAFNSGIYTSTFFCRINARNREL
jgi:hypothetical protein